MKLSILPLGPFASNCYIVGAEEGDEGMVIDAGYDAQAILHKVKDMGLKIKLIVSTHTHVDHIAAVKGVKEGTGARFALHKDDAKLLNLWGSTTHAPLGFDLPTPPSPDVLLQGGDAIKIGDLSFLVIHTPGHTPGGICLFGHGVVFSGDTLFQMSIGRFDLPGGDGSLLLESIHTKLFVLPDETIVYPGHGSKTTIGQEKQWNPWLRS
ncbi:MAG: MBL fold metallo-hydrolase [Chloroflexota bacterium]